jgi:hypothetical protein
MRLVTDGNGSHPPQADLRHLKAEDDAIFEYRPRPYLVTRRWVYEKPWEWGEYSPTPAATGMSDFAFDLPKKQQNLRAKACASENHIRDNALNAHCGRTGCMARIERCVVVPEQEREI